MKKIISILFLVCMMFSIGYAKDKDQPPSDYQGQIAEQPEFTKGDRWVYDRRGNVFFDVFIEETGGQLKFKRQWKDGGRGGIFRTPDLNFVRSTWKKNREVKEACDPHRGPFRFPLWVGKKWSYTYTVTKALSSIKTDRFGGTGELADRDADVKVIAYEQIQIPAGTFWSFKIEEVRHTRGAHYSRDYHVTVWYSPEVKNIIKVEEDKETMNRELIKYRLKSPD